MSRSDSEFIIGTPVELPAGERQRIEAEIQAHLDAADALILQLDAADGDSDLEPSLSGNGGYGIPTGHDLEGDAADDEPSLGWTLSGQLGGFDDREQECEDEGADEGAECFETLSRYFPPTRGDIAAAKEVRGFVRRVKRNGKLGRAVPVTAICVPTQEGSR